MSTYCVLAHFIAQDPKGQQHVLTESGGCAFGTAEGEARARIRAAWSLGHVGWRILAY